MLAILVFILLINTSSSVKTCDFYQTCKGETISTQDYVNCYGRQSCYSTIIDSPRTYTVVSLEGRFAGGLAQIESPTVNIPGYYGAYKAKITATTVNAWSRYAVREAEIKSSESELTVNIAAYEGGYLTDIICTNSQTCIVNCVYAEACYQVNLYCYSGSKCIFNSNCGDASSRDYCLNITQADGDTGLTDLDVYKIYLENKKRIPVDMIPNMDAPYELPNQFDTLNYPQLILLLLTALFMLSSIGLCLYNVSTINTTKRFVHKDDYS
eukprot:488419_1